jgi:hypothetical protein
MPHKRKIIERECPGCHQSKAFERRHKFCSPECGNRARRKGVPGRSTPDNFDCSGDSATINRVTETRIRTLEQLLEVCEVDGSEWEVERWVCNKWEIGAKIDDALTVEPLFQVKAWLKRKVHVVTAKAEIEALRQKAIGYSPRFSAILTRESKTGNLGEFSIFDHHFGAQIWGKETGAADYDLKIAETCWREAVLSLIDRTRHLKLDIATLVIGNDQQNADNRAGTTERGTQQVMDSRYQKVFTVSRDCTIWAVEQLRPIAPSVRVVVVPGNHDPVTAWHLGDSLSMWFHNCPGVTVDNAPTFRKYYQHGSTMLMWTHGNGGKLEDYGATMAAEQPRMWGATDWREAHTGDKHQRRLIEVKGATIRILPSLRPPCAWSSENHFLGSMRAAEAFIWNDREGLIGTACYSIFPNTEQSA